MSSEGTDQIFLREDLEDLRTVLGRHGELFFERMLTDALSGPDPTLLKFLMSNELWGGPGSIADQAGCGTGEAKSRARKEIEEALLQLGGKQIQLGIVNPHTQMWVDAFTVWHRKGIL